ncbi:MAG: tRNA lysidine(34) synthetase TilS [Betaproteobacteria bacterium HGW-Betaproteobacteria-7]|jgi:tRNA(Ile)-lysidine synthase|nr:MAG: tRNA lysidine(34) synthetase TilS [Betaproteobacteria bacterium HGW-Betaproteobacteria-7]
MAASRNRTSPDLTTRLAAFVGDRLAAHETVCVGLSGGCDSVVLLHLLSRLGLGERLSAVHVHHGLSPNADAWAGFCQRYCNELGVPLLVRRVSVLGGSGSGLEAAARQARYSAFAEVAADCLFLAQHGGDQAETLLLNLLRGCGVTGAAAMPIERLHGGRRLLRPLLGESRADIEAYAHCHGLRWVEDESNDNPAFTRNYLRHQVMPVIGKRFPAAEFALRRAAANFGEAAELLDELAAADWAVVADGETARLAGLRTLNPARLKNLLRYRLRVLGWQVPVADRLDEFVRQLIGAAPDRHPELILEDGRMRSARGRLHWLSAQ